MQCETLELWRREERDKSKDESLHSAHALRTVHPCVGVCV